MKSNNIQLLLQFHSDVSQYLLHCVSTDKTPFNGLFSRTTWVSQHQKGKPL